ncbi:hypothetical protein P7K49_022299 [Saguinus oedipus]|uniref:Uncharacterized protein n=1 Tax=Saguinus oedipus TaxID=9490 RepID=A0ABQ9UV81_SAGOE|nr:hypothetical protein P7K49_022299 [Saguinus oedipus]
MDQKIHSGGAPRLASATLVAGTVVLQAPRCGSSWCRVNGTGSPSVRRLELREGRFAYYRLKKEARQEIPGQKSTISLNTAPKKKRGKVEMRPINLGTDYEYGVLNIHLTAYDMTQAENKDECQPHHHEGAQRY